MSGDTHSVIRFSLQLEDGNYTTRVYVVLDVAMLSHIFIGWFQTQVRTPSE